LEEQHIVKMSRLLTRRVKGWSKLHTCWLFYLPSTTRHKQADHSQAGTHAPCESGQPLAAGQMPSA